MSGGKRPFRDDPTSYKKTGIPCGNPKRYQSHGVVRMVASLTPFRDQRLEMPAEDEIETEATLQLKELVRRQLNTRTTLEEQLSSKKQFTGGSEYRPLGDTVAGSRTFEEFRILSERDSRVEELRLCGLTDEEITLQLESSSTPLDAQTGSSGQRSGYGVDPSVLSARREAVTVKLAQRESRLSRPDTFSGSRQLGRHALQLERALTQGRPPLQCLIGPEATGQVADGDVLQDVLNPTTKCERPTETGRIIDDSLRTTDSEHVASIQEDERACKTKKAVDTLDNISTVEQPSRIMEPMLLNCEVKVIPSEVIRADRLSLEDILKLPRFQSYRPGDPCKILYLKNLAPKVNQSDLVSLFIRFQKSENVKIIFKLMTGRMKGQAFVTLQDVETATKALRLVNGYPLKGRPVIIQYGKQNTNKNY